MYVTMGYTTVYAHPLETISAAAAGGFKSVGLRITGRRPSDAYPEVVGSPEMMREMRDRLNGTGLRLSNVSTYHFHPELRIDDVVPVIEATAQLGADTIVASCYDSNEARYVDFLGRCCEAASHYHIRWALEFIPYSEAKTVEQALRFATLTGQANVGVLIDALHLDRSGGDPTALAKIDGHRISFVQLCDAKRERPASAEALRAEAFSGRLYPGAGDLPLYALLDVLPANIEIECECPNSAYSSLALPERARRAYEAVTHFLDDYRKKRHLIPKPPR